ncbi:MAG: hypothetical protein JKY41_09040, partial [Rhodobacteraceae bacterium]|nr:hypothetical protein [Paracoccaceae bacterium]
MTIAPILLFLVWGATAWATLGGGSAAASIAGAALLVFFIIELRKIARFGLILLLVSLILVGIHFYRGSLDGELLEKAVERAAFLAFFLISLFFLQSASATSALVRRSGEALVNQPPGRRYLALTFGGTIFGLLMSLGSLTLLGTMIRQGVKNSSNVKARDIRLRRMTLALLRSFVDTSFPLRSNTGDSLSVYRLADGSSRSFSQRAKPHYRWRAAVRAVAASF